MKPKYWSELRMDRKRRFRRAVFEVAILAAIGAALAWAIVEAF